MLRAVPSERLPGLAATDRGLDAAQVDARRTLYGSNLIVETVRGGWRQLALETLKDPMLWFLLATSALFAVVGDWTEAAILLCALVPIVGMDAFLHRRTMASTEGLRSRLASRSTVLREGQPQSIAATDLVPGDLVIVGSGEALPADGLVVDGERIQADESTLTGEAYPVRKEPLARIPPPDGEVRVDSRHWGFAGTRLLSGQARLRIVFTGGETLYGEIVRSAVRGVHTRTPLQAAVANLVSVLVIGAALICLALAWVRYQQGYGLLDALLSALTLAVAALPEEFPVVLTFFLGAGVYRLARRQALVRRAVVVENIGRVTVICSDKTGTVTEGRLRLAHRYPAAPLDEERLLLLAAAASRRETGDPMDVAILDSHARSSPFEAVASFPFTEDRRRETGIVREGGRLLATVKGAPEAVLAQCAVTAEQRGLWLQRIDELACGGHKVVACAWRSLDSAWPGGEPDRDFEFAGALAFEDPVRGGVREALQTCRAAKIRVILVTGDHPSTARAIAAEVGLGGDAPRVVEGDELQAQLARGDAGFLKSADVIARAAGAEAGAGARAAGRRRDRCGHRRWRQRRASAAGGRHWHRHGGTRHPQRARGGGDARVRSRALRGQLTLPLDRLWLAAPAASAGPTQWAPASAQSADRYQGTSRSGVAPILWIDRSAPLNSSSGDSRRPSVFFSSA